MDVTVDFETAPGADPATTRLTHTVDIRPRASGSSYAAHQAVLPKQTTGAMEKLKALAERGWPSASWCVQVAGLA